VIVNAAYTPASVDSSSSSAAASQVIILETQTIVAVAEDTAAAVAAAGPTAGTASNSRVYAGSNSSSTSAYEKRGVAMQQMEMRAVAKGAASNVHTDIGLCVLALFIGAFFVM
jgi:hypothetical protein